MNESGRYENSRGCACEFGPDVVDTFFANNPPLNMIVRSHEMEEKGFAQWFGGKLFTVFSCSNYQGSVGNHGAYCVIEKGAKPRFTQYYAQKDLGGGVHQQHSLLQNDVVTKLLNRICAARLPLINRFLELDSKKTGNVSRDAWCQVLQETLGLKINFLEFQSYIGLPDIGVHGEPQGPIDYMDFCNSYLIYNSNIEKSALEQGEVSAFFNDMMAVMYARRYEMDSLFRFFDTNGMYVSTYKIKYTMMITL